MLEELGHCEWDASANIDHLGLKPLQLRQVARDRADIRVVARPIREALARRYQETINLGLLNP